MASSLLSFISVGIPVIRSGLRPAACLACGLGFTSGCIISSPGGSSSDGTQTATGGATASNTGVPSSGTSGGDSTGASGVDEGTSGTTTGMLPDDCGENVIVDPGFEDGLDGPWTAQSEVFGTPLCDSECTDDPGAEPHTGEWYVWFGGVDEADDAFVEQTVSFEGAAAFVTFYLDINAAAGAGDDVFAVAIDGTTVFMLTDADMAGYDGYRYVQVDVSEFADGLPHSLRFSAALTGLGVTNFFLDDVGVVGCGTPGGSSSSGTSSSSSTSSGSEDDTATETETETGTTLTGTDG